MLLPVVELLLWTSVSLFLALVVLSGLESFQDLVTPLVEDLLEVRDHLGIWLLVTVSGRSIPLRWILSERDVGLQALECFFELAGELVEDGVELLLLFGLADTPC